MSTMLQTEHLTFAYPAEEGESAPTAALEDVTLSVEKGSFVEATFPHKVHHERIRY